MEDASKTAPSPPTLHDVAREAGVSVATASRALNGSARNVRSENVRRVRAAAAKLNYEPHLSAQAIAKGSTRTVALVVGDVADPYFSAIAAGVSGAAEEAGLIVTMAVADRSPDRELEIVRTLRGQRPRVLIIAGSRVDGTDTRAPLIEELEEYRTTGGRVIMISQRDLPFATVTVDNHGGARRLAHALARLGYRRYAIFRAPERVRTSTDRCAGFLAGLRESGAGGAPPVVVEAEFTRSGGHEAARRLLERGYEDVEAVFAVNDVMAIGAMTALRESGVVPGRDLAVAGFDDIGSAVDVVPPLTSVAVPLKEAGLRAMRLALSPDDRAAEERIATHVVVRESTPVLRPSG
ncbi:LacI family DNA-binding transcriptional regulator [Nonomuraea sp. K274]|uniref:LacI family DNA-binding transcriptional regulator n=1 Tax=Nonomuraea cypriaca TaxID=1187855 RepID=A0A931A9E7_9ACTN|nr:LacI family DNA-binding transcriptional regulator [Nonomuraea cypriaca]MBF8188802.1 LacI family DNA-binding transcriptional regulator [Nonomuraea cypriaca]